MTKLSRLFNKHGVIVSVLFLLLLIVVNASLVFVSTEALKENRRTQEKVRDIKASMGLVLSHLQMADLGFRGYLVVENEDILEPFTVAKQIYGSNFNELASLMESQGLQTSYLRDLQWSIGGYMNLLDSLIELKDTGQESELKSVLEEDRGFQVFQQYLNYSSGLNAYEDDILQKANAQYDSIFFNLIFVQILLLILGIPTIFWVIFTINKSRKRRLALFQQLDESNRKMVYDNGQKVSFQEEEQVINNLIENLEIASDFIKEITSSNYEVQWRGYEDNNDLDINKHNLSGELTKMRDTMQSVKKEDGQRIWITEGLAKFSEVLRTSIEQDANDFRFILISEIIQYMKASHGVLFLTEEEDDSIHIKAKASYAYSRKKLIHLDFKPGEGLIGQAYQEKDIINLTDIPEDFINITSGLGHSLPRNVLIVPLLFDNKVMGLIELASFNLIQPHEIEFMEKLSSIIASAMHNASINEKTQDLLNHSKLQTEQMRAQEEEMRQNMEELQATQEEMQRKERETQEALNDLEKENRRLSEQEEQFTQGLTVLK